MPLNHFGTDFVYNRNVNQLKLKTMGWIKKETMTDDELLEQLKSVFPSKFSISRGVASSGSYSVYEYLTDYIKDYYDVTLEQCSRVSKQLADFYGIKKFYATD